MSGLEEESFPLTEKTALVIREVFLAGEEGLTDYNVRDASFSVRACEWAAKNRQQRFLDRPA